MAMGINNDKTKKRYTHLKCRLAENWEWAT
jgi:hypothetical protein